jgi:hypothetical protein
MAKLKNLGTIITNQSCIYEESNSGLNLENACCYSVQNTLPSSLLPKILKFKIYVATTLLLFCMSVKFCITLRGDDRLKVDENRVLRKIFRPKKEEVEGDLRRLYNEKLHYLYASPYMKRMIKSRLMRWVVSVASVGEMRNAYKIFV